MFSFNFTELITEVNPKPSKWQEKDVQPKNHNSDCYYTTLAGLMGKTIEELEIQTGIKCKEYANEDEIAFLYNTAGYSGKFEYFSNKNDAKAYICENLKYYPQYGIRLPIGYLNRNYSIGHVATLVAYIKHDNQNSGPKYYIVDFQKDVNLRFIESKQLSLPEVDYYWIWETSHRYYMKSSI